MLTVLLVFVVIETLALLVLGAVFLRNNAYYHRISEKVDLIAKGKLDIDDLLTSGKKTTNAAMLAGGFDAVKNNLLTFVEATKVNVITLSDAIDILSRSVNANQAGNEQIADSVTTAAQKTGEQMELVKQNLSLIESSNEQIQDIDKSIAVIKGKLDDTVQSSKKGMEDITGYSADMDEVNKDLKSITDILVKFNDEIKQIEDIGNIIIEINNQLTLLAFNASIEAARAGEAGRGFTVVADEMNHMSNETKKGMGSIREILEEIGDSTQQFNESIAKCETAFNNSKTTFNNVSDSLNTINRQAFEIHGNIQEIAEKTGSIASNSEELKNQASELHNATQMITEKTHEIAAATQETAAESSQIGVNVESLNGMLDSIQGLLGQFRTSVLPTEKKSNRTIKIAFLTMLDNDFWFGVRKGVFYAEKELKDKDARIDYFAVDTKSELPADRQVSDKLRQCIDDKYDGIIFAGFLNGTVQLLQEAISKGIKVVAFNCDCSSEIERCAVFSPDAIEAGELAGKCMEQALNKKGNVAIISGDLSIKVNKDRREGFVKALSASKGIHVVEECETDNDANIIYDKAKQILSKHSDLDAFYVTSGLQASVAKAIMEAGKKGQVVSVGFDDSQEILEYIEKGVIYATIKQDPFGQGHDPIIWLYNHIVTNVAFPRVEMGCRLSVVDRNNVGSLIKA